MGVVRQPSHVCRPWMKDVEGPSASVLGSLLVSVLAWVSASVVVPVLVPGLELAAGAELPGHVPPNWAFQRAW